MGAQLAAFAGLQRLFDKRAEDGGFDIAPVVGGGGQKFADLLTPHRERLRVLEQAAVEMFQVQAEPGVEAVVVVGRIHAAPQGFKHGGEAVGMVELVLQQGREAAARQ